MVDSCKTTLVCPRALREGTRPSAADMKDRIGKKFGIDGFRVALTPALPSSAASAARLRAGPR